MLLPKKRSESINENSIITNIMTSDKFYELWERFSSSDIAEELPDDVEKFCKENRITLDYFIQEFI